jgi:peptide deformylase
LTVREIRLYGDPVLRTSSAPVTDLIAAKGLIQDLLDTTALPGRAGVAAPQIGVNLRAFSFHVNGELGYLINPKIVEMRGDKLLLEEGCLSVPGLWHKTPRFEEVVAEGQDLDGNAVRIEAQGLLAQALQHECDHLEGMVYLDRLLPNERKLAMRKLREADWFMN